MNQTSTGGNFINNLNNAHINSNIMNKFNKINKQNFKTISIRNSRESNINSYSKDKINNTQEGKKKSLSNKKLNIQKEKRNNIPKMKKEIVDNSSNNHTNNNNVNIYKNKRELHLRNNSSHHQKSNDLYDKNSKELNLLRKKILIGNNNNMNNNNKYIPRSNDRLATNNNIVNSENKSIRRSITNGNKNENRNINFSVEVDKYKNIIKILLLYIEKMNKKIKFFFHKNQIEKNNKIKELSLQNKFLLNENKNLKLKIIQNFYIMKLYMKNWKKLFIETYLKIIKQLITENKFLRGINILPKNINNDYLSQLNKQIQIEKMKRELLIHNQFMNKEENTSKDNYKNNDKDMISQFNQTNNSFNDLNNIIFHKRQKTHFNLGKLNEDNNIKKDSNRDSINSSHNTSKEKSSISINTVVENKEKGISANKQHMMDISKSYNKNDNVFCETLREMTAYNRVLKKANNNSKKNIFEKSENSVNDLNKNKIDENNGSNTRLNKYVNKAIKNIPYNLNRTEQINHQNDSSRKEIKNGLPKKEEDIKNHNLKSNILNMFENSLNKKQLSIYYRSSREKDRKVIEFTK